MKFCTWTLSLLSLLFVCSIFACELNPWDQLLFKTDFCQHSWGNVWEVFHSTEILVKVQKFQRMFPLWPGLKEMLTIVQSVSSRLFESFCWDDCLMLAMDDTENLLCHVIAKCYLQLYHLKKSSVVPQLLALVWYSLWCSVPVVVNICGTGICLVCNSDC